MLQKNFSRQEAIVIKKKNVFLKDKTKSHNRYSRYTVDILALKDVSHRNSFKKLCFISGGCNHDLQ